MSTTDIDRLADDIAICATRIDAATHQLLTHIREFDTRRGWARQGALSCAHWLTWRIGLGKGAAREKVRVARALGELPLVDAALSRGQLSYAKVRALTRVATPDNEQLLLDMARAATGAALEKVCAKFRGLIADPSDEERRFVRRRHMPDGTVRIEMRLEPDEAERMWQALRETRMSLAADVSAETPDDALPTLADAAVAMAEQALASPALETASSKPAASRRRRALAAERRQLLVHLREDHLIPSRWSAELHDGTPIRGETLKRIACDAGLVAAKMDSAGNVLDIGRRRRTVSQPLLRALLMRQRSCCFPGCDHALFVEAHHIEHWMDGGDTSVDNVVLLCTAHHRALHEGGFSMTSRKPAPAKPGGELEFRGPCGDVIAPAPRPPRLRGDALPALEREQQQAGIHIDRRTSLPDWTGDPLDLHTAVGALACAVAPSP